MTNPTPTPRSCTPMELPSILVIELYPFDLTCQNCGDEGRWQECREWYENGPARGSGLYGFVCPTCLPVVDAMAIRALPLAPGGDDAAD